MANLKDIAFEIIQKCPNNCLHCSSVASLNCTHIIELDVFCKVIKDAIQLGLRHVSISGGEPFEHPELDKMVLYAKEQGLDISIYTSGLYTRNGRTEAISLDTLRKLKKVGVNNLMFNLPSTKTTVYDRIMGTKGKLPQVLEAIQSASQLGIQTEIHFVPMFLNLPTLEDLLVFASKYDIKVSFLRLVLQGRAITNEEELNIHEEFVKRYINETKSRLETRGIYIRTRNGTPLSDVRDENCCTAAKSKIIIRYDGAVFPCEAYKSVNEVDAYGNLYYPDNVNETSITNIWEGSKFLSLLREEMSMFFCNKCVSENCPAQYRLAMKRG